MLRLQEVSGGKNYFASWFFSMHSHVNVAKANDKNAFTGFARRELFKS